MKNKLIDNSIEQHKEIINNIDKEKIFKASEMIINAIDNKSTIFWCGNGGSASQANHLSAELVGGMYKKKISPFNSVCLNTDTAFITAWSNDDSFENIFSRQLEAYGKEKDLIIVLSTSGNSKNIINVSNYARENNIKVISLTGASGGELANLSNLMINIDCDSTQRIQEMHILVGHIICDLVENHYNL